MAVGTPGSFAAGHLNIVRPKNSPSYCLRNCAFHDCAGRAALFWTDSRRATSPCAAEKEKAARKAAELHSLQITEPLHTIGQPGPPFRARAAPRLENVLHCELQDPRILSGGELAV